MPELPEVQALARLLDARLARTRLASFEVGSLSALKTVVPSPQEALGRSVVSVRRHGKFIAIRLDAPDDEEIILAWHLSRAGWVNWRDDLPATPLRPGKSGVALRLGFVNDDGESIGGFDLTEAGTQKRLSVFLVRALNDVPGIARLGVDPLSESFTPEAFDAICAAAGRTQVKEMLRDQSAIAGIGNGYSDEILHVARLSPFLPTSALTADQRRALYGHIHQTLQDAIEETAGKQASELKDVKRTHFAVHGRTGQPCPACGDVICEVSFADRSLQYCATCQTQGKPLADRRLSRLLK